VVGVQMIMCVCVLQGKGKGKGKSAVKDALSLDDSAGFKPLRTLDVFAGCGGTLVGLTRTSHGSLCGPTLCILWAS
jgi:hypothetical protein